MKIAHYSDLHCEFGHNWVFPADLDADVIVLAGDIISFSHFGHMRCLLMGWEKPVVYVAGNHEHYAGQGMGRRLAEFREWAAKTLPQLHVLERESLVIDGISFFGGTMWTNFGGAAQSLIRQIEWSMADFSRIHDDNGLRCTARMYRDMHKAFRTDLVNWLKKTAGPKVIVSHHAPVSDPATRHSASPLNAAFCCTDMAWIAEKYAPDLWIYGHTHEQGDYCIGTTRFVSNPLGYWQHNSFEVAGFDPCGHIIEIMPDM